MFCGAVLVPTFNVFPPVEPAAVLDVFAAPVVPDAVLVDAELPHAVSENTSATTSAIARILFFISFSPFPFLSVSD